jgi:GH25 family lysozyme M1 (1,4-beta-N-acetylmuramidase)
MRKKIMSTFLIMTVLFFVNINFVYSITPIGVPKYQGIDVSDWQGYIDYQEVRNNGIEIVYIKSSQGSNYKDPYFDINYENAKANGLKVGFYHFLTATNTEEAEQEASFFASVISGKSPDCKLVMDYETFGGIRI